MKKIILLFLLATTCRTGFSQTKNSGYPINPVPFTSVQVTDKFWGQRLDASREVTIPLAFGKCEETGRYENFYKAAHPSPDYKVGGFSFDDTDVYKTIEGASYSMQTLPDKKLAQYIDSVLAIVAAAQEPDGYLYTARTMNPQHPHRRAGSERWEKEEEMSHELYNLGHLLEGAIAHYQATGKRNFLDIAIRYADCAERSIGDKPGQVARVPGHQIAEMGLAKLYVVTGDKKYLDLAKYLLDKRGYTSKKDANKPSDNLLFLATNGGYTVTKDAYSQAHKPIVEQDEAVGHAVRAAYMYSGIADVAALTGDTAYIRAIDRIWDNVVSKKLYITGGIGARHKGEAFGDNYELPNLTAYNETCAAIANVYWNYRLFLLHGDAKYFDVLERTLYNGLISGVSLDGGAFFYPNPLESDGKYKFNSEGTLVRQPWFGCACCPSNVSRFIPSLPGYVYAVNNDDVYVNLFIGNTADLTVNGKKVSLTQSTDYPWTGDIHIKVSPRSKQQFTLKVRVPGWVQGQPLPSDLYSYADGKKLNYTVTVNGAKVDNKLDKGYFAISRQWKKGDVVEVHFDMEPRVVKANDKVEADRGKIAIERGPLVYCAEWADNDFDIFAISLSRNPVLKADKTDLLGGVYQIKSDAQALSYDNNGRLQIKDVSLKLIPYYAWNHRGSGNMAVWLTQQFFIAKR
ncbi:hypothetical protein AGMMS4956_13440 [Bacteroidia bacterium]|nr:hypothetical protein AGMMS4956_13440 [Bacteroidia bacterium]